MRKRPKSGAVTRRQAMAAFATIGGGALVARDASMAATQESLRGILPAANVCVLTPEAVEGPFYFDPKLVRADITEGKAGVPLKLTLELVEAKDCAKLARACVDIWHADGLGVYSGYARQQTGSTSCAGRNSPPPTGR
jgi:protocatechuate 3,4-dioxygenase beta subunit